MAAMAYPESLSRYGFKVLKIGYIIIARLFV